MYLKIFRALGFANFHFEEKMFRFLFMLLALAYPLASHAGAMYSNFDDNANITEAMAMRIKPHLLPLYHPIKSVLDEIFQKPNILKNENTFAAAGFLTVSYRTSSFIRVAKHPLLPGYLVKVYLSTQPNRRRLTKPDWKALVHRCEGAASVRSLIAKKHLRYFTVPDKWIYPLPLHALTEIDDADQRPQYIILVVTDMEILPGQRDIWKHKVSKEILDELFCILSHGYASTFLPGNIPLTKSGKFACIDTEFPKRRYDYQRVKEFLSPSMCAYWDSLVEKGSHL